MLSLRPFFPVMGTDALEEQQTEEADLLKRENLMMGMTAYNPLGQLDNKFWLGNMANQGMRNMGEMFEMPVLYSGGTLTDGATLFGSYRKRPAVPDGRIETSKRRRVR